MMYYKYENNVLIVINDQGEYVGEFDYLVIFDYDNCYVIEWVFVVFIYWGIGVVSDLVKIFVEYVKEEGWVIKLMCLYVVVQFKCYFEY